MAKKMENESHGHKTTLDEKRFGLATGITGALMGLLSFGARGMMGGGWGMMGGYGGLGALGIVVELLLSFGILGITGYAVAWIYNKL